MLLLLLRYFTGCMYATELMFLCMHLAIVILAFCQFLPVVAPVSAAVLTYGFFLCLICQYCGANYGNTRQTDDAYDHALHSTHIVTMHCMSFCVSSLFDVFTISIAVLACVRDFTFVWWWFPDAAYPIAAQWLCPERSSLV